MDLPELYRRAVVLPLTPDAILALEDCRLDASTPVECLRIDEGLVGILWASGLFDRINEACASLVDDYEEEVIAPEQIRPLIALLGRPDLLRIRGPIIEAFCRDLRELAKKAAALGLPLFFVR